MESLEHQLLQRAQTEQYEFYTFFTNSKNKLFGLFLKEGKSAQSCYKYP